MKAADSICCNAVFRRSTALGDEKHQLIDRRLGIGVWASAFALTMGTAQLSMIEGLAFEDIALDMSASVENTVSEVDIQAFANVSGDRNPVHLDAEYAKGTPFKGQISHGMLTASYISAVFGMQLPGPGAIYVSQTLNFKRPVRIGDQITTTVRVAELSPEKKRVRFDCVCMNGDGKAVLDGEAVLMVPQRDHA